MIAGLAELKRQGFQVVANQDSKADGYFAGPALDRMNGFLSGIQSEQIDGLVALRGGYGSNYLLEFDLAKNLEKPKSVIGFSDLTTLQIDRKSTRLNSSHEWISYAVFCLKKKNKIYHDHILLLEDTSHTETATKTTHKNSAQYKCTQSPQR